MQCEKMNLQKQPGEVEDHFRWFVWVVRHISELVLSDAVKCDNCVSRKHGQCHKTEAVWRQKSCKPKRENCNKVWELFWEIVMQFLYHLSKSYRLQLPRFKELTGQFVKGTRPISLQKRRTGLRHSCRPWARSMFTSDTSEVTFILFMCMAMSLLNAMRLSLMGAAVFLTWQTSYAFNVTFPVSKFQLQKEFVGVACPTVLILEEGQLVVQFFWIIHVHHFHDSPQYLQEGRW